MNLRLFVALAIALVACQAVAQDKAGKKGADAPAGASPLKTNTDKASYAIGLDIGKDLKKSMIQVEISALAAGIRDALSGAKPLLSKEETQTVMQELQKSRMAAMEKAGEESKAAGDAFLNANKKKEGIKTTPSGLQYKIIKAGTGKKPIKTDLVKANYRGTLIDGTEFDSSAQHGGPATLPVNGVIAGWQEALQLMPVGSKWQLYIPASLAYGDEARSELIGPNTTLLFDLELLSIEKPGALQGGRPPVGQASEEEDDDEEEEVQLPTKGNQLRKK